MLASTALFAALALAAHPPKPNVVRIAAHDFAYTMPDSLPAGLTTVEMTNDGRELHHAIFFRLEGGKRLSDLAAAMKAGGPMPMWAVPVGGPNGPAPGGISTATMNLKPGRYALLCAIPGPDGVPHVMKGMSKEVTVTGKADPNPAFPKADINLRLADYSFTFDKPLRAGRQNVQVTVAPGQPHEVVLIRLAPGKTAQDVAAWGEKPAGPPPGEFAGGMAPMIGESPTQFSLDLKPGEYAMLCFVPDGKDGKPHHMHGMIKQFKVAA